VIIDVGPLDVDEMGPEEALDDAVTGESDEAKVVVRFNVSVEVNV
jgi:hypothetical protein